MWDINTGDLTRVINPNIDGIFMGMALSKDDKYAVAYSNDNQVCSETQSWNPFKVVLMSLITGEYCMVEPDGMENQMEIGKVEFTPEQNILLWSSSQFYIYSVEGKLLHREKVDSSLGGQVAGVNADSHFSGFSV